MFHQGLTNNNLGGGTMATKSSRFKRKGEALGQQKQQIQERGRGMPQLLCPYLNPSKEFKHKGKEN